MTAVTSKLMINIYFCFDVNEGHNCMAFFTLDRALQRREQRIGSQRENEFGRLPTKRQGKSMIRQMIRQMER